MNPTPQQSLMSRNWLNIGCVGLARVRRPWMCVAPAACPSGRRGHLISSNSLACIPEVREARRPPSLSQTKLDTYLEAYDKMRRTSAQLKHAVNESYHESWRTGDGIEGSEYKEWLLFDPDAKQVENLLAMHLQTLRFAKKEYAKHFLRYFRLSDSAMGVIVRAGITINRCSATSHSSLGLEQGPAMASPVERKATEAFFPSPLANNGDLAYATKDLSAKPLTLS